METMKREKNIWTYHMKEEEWASEFFDGSMYDKLISVAKQVPNQTALVFEGKKTSYKQLIFMIEKTAKCLKSMGIQRGDVVSIISPNMPQAVFMFYAVNKLGAVANMINPLLSRPEIKDSVEKTKSKIIMILDQIYPKIAGLAWDNIEYPTIVITKVSDALPGFKRPVYNMMIRKKMIPIKNDVQTKKMQWNDFIELGNNIEVPDEKGFTNDTAAILFSGGTSGNPKGVMLTNGNFNSLHTQLYEVTGFSYTLDMAEQTMALIPIFHGFGLGVALHGMLCFGMKIYLLPTFDFEKSINLVFKRKIEFVYGVPALFEAMSRNPLIEKSDLSFIKMIVSGGDRLPVELQHRMNAYLTKGGSSTLMREAYGQTECICVCAMNPFFDIRIGSVGIAYPDMHIKIVKPGTTDEVERNTDGELCVNGPTVMKGYFDNPEETARALKIHPDGKIWLHTGDILSMDEDGFLYYKQRLSRMIISSGYNVYLNRIEETVCSCPFVRNACAVGIDDKIVGKRISVFVELKDGHPTEAECETKIKTVCKEKLASYYQPSRISFINAFPRTGMGKIDYKKLEEEV